MALDYDNKEAFAKNNNRVVRGIFSSSRSSKSKDEISRINFNIAKKHEEILPPTTQNIIISFEDGLEYILSHFEEPIWPRTIFTNTIGKQVLVFNKEEAVAKFKQANLQDCRINAYPYYTEFDGINRQPPNFIFIDIDRATFDTDRKFELAVNKTCDTIKEILGGGYPTKLWTGNGIHIYQPVQGVILENESAFSKFDFPSQRLLKFAAKHLSNGKSDSENNPAFRSCLVRIPGTHNFKCVQKYNGIADSTTEVKIIQKWDGHRPKINPLLYRFYIWLAGEKVKEINQLHKISKGSKKYANGNNGIDWIEKLLQTPITDHRKFVSHWILSRYLINVKRMNPEKAYAIMKDWSIRCNAVEALSPSVREFDNRIRYDIKEAVKNGKAPIGKNLLSEMNKELYAMLFLLASSQK